MGKLSNLGGVLLVLLTTLLTAQTTAPVGANGNHAANQKSLVQEPVKQELRSREPGNPEAGSQELAIRAELERQVSAWNRGDLKGYMEGYWRSPELTFFAGSQESAGWEAAYQRYRTAYLGKDKQMGRLNFSQIRVQMLGPEAAFVRGGWQLTMKNGSKRVGLFTVVLKKFSEGWRVIHDHSS